MSTTFHSAVLPGNKNSVITLGDAGHNPNEYDDDGQTALIIACKKTNANIVGNLLDACGGNVNGKDKLGFAPLYHAIYHNKVDIIQLLINRGCSKHFRDVFTYVELAMKCGHTDVVKLLLSLGFAATMHHPVNLFSFLSTSTVATRRFNEIVQVLDKWSTTMLLIVFDELQVLGSMDPTSFYDFAQYL
jgi:ankyrin repeat protein